MEVYIYILAGFIIGTKGLVIPSLWGLLCSFIYCVEELCFLRLKFFANSVLRFICFVNTMQKRLTQRVIIITILLGDKTKLVFYQKDFYTQSGFKSLKMIFFTFLNSEIMQKLSFNKGLNAAAIALILLFSINTLKAQPSCSYNVNNNGSCTAYVDVVFMSLSQGVCATFTNVPINPYSTLNFSCSGCIAPLIDVNVTLISISSGSSPGGTGTVNSSNTTDSGILSPSACNSQSSYDMNWNTGATNIDY